MHDDFPLSKQSALMSLPACLPCLQPKLVLPTPTPGLLAVDPAVAWVQPVLR